MISNINCSGAYLTITGLIPQHWIHIT